MPRTTTALSAWAGLVCVSGALILQADSKSPELLTVMYKREKDYNPAAGDWEYLVLNGAGTKVEARGHLGNCQSCHAQWKKTDYVSRVYFTEAMRRRFR